MEKFTLFCADVRENQRNVSYPYAVEIGSADDLARAAAFDHVAAAFVGNRRSRAGFLSADCVPLDLDNDHSEAPADWKSLSDVHRSFPGVEFFAVASRNHLRAKGDKAPREKWHIYFPVHRTSDAGAIETIKRRAARIFPFFDQNALDAARFFFGVSKPQVRYYPGETTLDTYLICFSPPEAAKATPPERQAPGIPVAALPAPSDRRPVIQLGEDVEEGHRNTELSRFAFSRWMRGLTLDEVRFLTEEVNSRFSDPLPADEVETIIRSACSKPGDRAAFIHRAEVAAEFAETVQNIGGAGKDDPNAAVQCLADMREQAPAWLVEGYIPAGEITIMAGDGGVGKTFLWCALAAAISSGRRPFLLNDAFSEGVEGAPGKVLYFSSEDSNRAVLRPRLRACGANLRNIVTIDPSHPAFSQVKMNSSFLQELVAQYRPALVIFDPLQSFISPRADMSSRNQMRDALSKLHVLGENYGSTFLIVAHTNKQTSVWGRTRLADSADLWDVSRSVLICGHADEKLHTRYVSQEKCSYGALSPTVLFRISENAAEFVGYTDKRDMDFVRAANKLNAGAPEKNAAEQFIIEYLSARGEVLMHDLDAAAAGNFISARTLRRAKETLKSAGRIRVWSTGSGAGKGVVWHVALVHAADGQIEPTSQ